MQFTSKVIAAIIGLLVFLAPLSAIADNHSADNHNEMSDIPDLVGKWSGKNNTVSGKKGYLTRDKNIEITEQKGRRFKGTYSYSEGTVNFFGVIYPDNKSFTWVSHGSRGYNHGRILSNNQISACYIEAGLDATAGCAELTRQ